MEEKIYHVDFETLENFMRDALIGAGVPANDAATCAEVLITADKLGIDSHGIGRLKPIYIDRIKAGIQNPVTQVEWVKKSPKRRLLVWLRVFIFVISAATMADRLCFPQTLL